MGNPKLKVLVAIPSAFCFGLQHVSVDLFGASSHAIQPHFLISWWNDGEFKKLLKRHDFPHSLSWLGMFSRKRDWRNIKMSLHALVKLPKLYFDFIRLCRKQKPDLLFFANHHELLLLMPVLMFTRIKVVCHMHDPSPAIPFQRRTFSWYGRVVDHFIAISDDVKTRLMALGCSEDKISVLHNGITIPQDIELHGRKFRDQFHWPENSFIVGITGQMTVTKGHEDLVDAFAHAHQKNQDLRLVIGGRKLQPLFSMLQKTIEDRGLQDVIRFSGWIDDVADFYKGIDLFVLASRHDEGYGLVVAESMAHGKPVVITNSGGATEIVEDGVNGYVVAKQDINAMAEKILALSIDPDTYRQFSSMARTRILRNFDIAVVAEKFISKLNLLK